METAIKKAIEGGYKHYDEDKVLYGKYQILLDPLFWQALGKAEKWESEEWDSYTPVWKENWHDFVDHLASGKSIDSFFENLLQEITKETK